MKLTAEELKQNYDYFIACIENYITGDRKQKVLDMVEDLSDEMVTAPASGRTYYHGAYPGGYLVHVLNVVRFALKVKSLFETMGGKVDFTDEELVFSALFHDLGKVGNGQEPTYVPQESDWHRKNQGSVYINNPKLDFMLVPDRSLYLLQKYGVTVNQKEYLAIKLHDGLFEETNKPYLISFNPDSKLKTNIVTVLHVADHLAATAELDKEQSDD